MQDRSKRSDWNCKTMKMTQPKDVEAKKVWSFLIILIISLF
ncbi:hypothetical protein [Peribacillus frigoritolerans]|nr:hypothetical protein [Peribacillus frigoritolerans]